MSFPLYGSKDTQRTHAEKDTNQLTVDNAFKVGRYVGYGGGKSPKTGDDTPLNTFLNAMTYPDKTCYPVASCNDQDFQNLMHVYLDAVFYPNIIRKRRFSARKDGITIWSRRKARSHTMELYTMR